MFDKLRHTLSRKVEPLSVKAIRILRRNFPDERTKIVGHFKEDIASGILTEERLYALLDSIERGASVFSRADTFDAARYGLKSRGQPVTFDYHRKAAPTNDYRGAEMSNMYINDGDVRNADFSHIRMKGVKLDLQHNGLCVTNENPWDTKTLTNDLVGHCADCERLNRSILGTGFDAEKHHVRRGMLFFWNNHPIGYVKLKGERSFLALRTVQDAEGNVVFWKGMVYAFDHKLNDWLRDIATQNPVHNQWLAMDVETILKKYGEKGCGRREMKFIQDPKLYPAFDELVDNIESYKEPYIKYISPI